MTANAMVTALTHLGEPIGYSKFGQRMSRKMYGYPMRSEKQSAKKEWVGQAYWDATAWAYRDEDHRQLSDAAILAMRDRALVNFDLSLAYFAALDPAEFESSLQALLARHPKMKQVEHLPDFEDVSGVYIMVFDEYKQMYIGKADNVRRRVKQHWSNRKPFDRLVYGSEYTSIFPVDEFRQLDNTRLFALKSDTPYNLETKIEKSADKRFCLNRIDGGSKNPLQLMVAGMSPRARDTGLAFSPMTHAEYQVATQEIDDLVASMRESGAQGLVNMLAAIDRRIHRVTGEDGEQFYWSARRRIRTLLTRGALSVEEYRQYLTLIGEDPVLPA